MSATPAPCPTPDKWTFLSREGAKERAKKQNRSKHLKPYRCRCGKWHLTHKRRHIKRVRGQLNKMRGN